MQPMMRALLCLGLLVVVACASSSEAPHPTESQAHAKTDRPFCERLQRCMDASEDGSFEKLYGDVDQCIATVGPQSDAEAAKTQSCTDAQLDACVSSLQNTPCGSTSPECDC